MSKILSEIEIDGRTFRIGMMTSAMHREAQADCEFFALMAAKGPIKLADLYGDNSAEIWAANERLALLLLREHAPDLTVEWLDDNCTPEHLDLLAQEMLRQRIDLAVADGQAGRA